MRLEEAYRTLELPPGASDADAKLAWRELTKVWHPDRFGHDPALRRRAEEKSKALNEALEAVRAAREGIAAARGGEGAPAGPPVESGGPEPAAARRRFRTNRSRALLAAGLAVFLLLRRPTPAGLAVALALLGLVVVFVSRMRAAARDEAAAGLPGNLD